MLLLFFGQFVSYSMRVNLSVAIVAMTTPDNTNGQMFDWDDSVKGLLLSSQLWIYILCLLPGSQIARYFGPKAMFIICGIGSGCLTIAMPWAASIDWKLLMITRMAWGIFQCTIYPCTHMVLSKWAHPSERARIASVAYSGSSLGTVFILAIGGTIAASPLGWPGIFYCSGAFGLLWSLMIFIFLSNSPAMCKGISNEERTFLESIPGMATTTTPTMTKVTNAKLPVPWQEIFTSKALLAIIAVQLTHNWGYWTLLSMVPTYMKQVLDFDIQSVSKTFH